MESWRKVWQEGVAPLIEDEGLVALRQALLDDDPTLIQGCTATPPPLSCVQDWDVNSACALGFCGWKGLGLSTVGEVEEYFARMCYNVDLRLGEPAGCRWFLNWFDETPRDEMRRCLLEEVELEISRRSAAPAE